jgi:hypothetical protein
MTRIWSAVSIVALGLAGSAEAQHTVPDTSVLDVVAKWYVSGSDSMLVASPLEQPTGSVFKGLLAYGQHYSAGGQIELNRLRRPADSRHLHSAFHQEADYTIWEGHLSYLSGSASTLNTAMTRWYVLSNDDHPIGMSTTPPEECGGLNCTLPSTLGYTIPRFGKDRELLTTVTNGVAGNDRVTLKSNKVAGGAIYELSWRGKQFINDWDLAGRSLQTAVFFTSNSSILECDNPNPTEAGDKYGRPYHAVFNPNGPDPWPHGSPVLSMTTGATSLDTSTRPLMWEPSCFYGSDLLPATDDIRFAHPVLWDGVIGKTIEMNYAGHPRIMKWISKIDFSHEYPPLPVNSSNPQNASIYPVVVHLTAEFTNWYLYDAAASVLHTVPPPPDPNVDRCTWPYQTWAIQPQSGGGIVSTGDGSYAMGFFYNGGLHPDPYFTDRKEGFNFCDFVDSQGTGGKYDFATTQLGLNLQPAHVGPAYGQYQAVAYVIVGSLCQVITDMQTLHGTGVPACP